ncbi:hypothetical protein ACYSNM_11245 [Myroides sp. LJL116]
MTQEAKNIRKIKILEGLDLAYKKMIKFKRETNGEIIILQDNKIVKVKP